MLSGCASMFSGKTQNTALETDPEGAACSVKKNGFVVDSVSKTPSGIGIQKSKEDLRITCKKEGFSDSETLMESSVDPVTFVNLLFWPGFIIDASTGAMFEYPERIKLDLNTGESTTDVDEAKKKAAANPKKKKHGV